MIDIVLGACLVFNAPHTVCYSDLWLYKPTYKEAIIAETQLGYYHNENY